MCVLLGRLTRARGGRTWETVKGVCAAAEGLSGTEGGGGGELLAPTATDRLPATTTTVAARLGHTVAADAGTVLRCCVELARRVVH